MDQPFMEQPAMERAGRNLIVAARTRKIVPEVAKHGQLKDAANPIRQSPFAQMITPKIEWTEEIDEEPVRRKSVDPVTSRDSRFHTGRGALLGLTARFKYVEFWEPQITKEQFSSMLNLSDGTRIPDEIARACGCVVYADWDRRNVKIATNEHGVIERVIKKLKRICDIFNRRFEPIVVHLLHPEEKRNFEFKIVSFEKQKEKERTTLFPRGSKWYRYPSDLLFTVRMFEYQAASEKFMPCKLKIQTVYTAHHALFPREWLDYTFPTRIRKDGDFTEEKVEEEDQSGLIPIFAKNGEEEQLNIPEVGLQDRLSEFYRDETLMSIRDQSEHRLFLAQINGRSEGLMGDDSNGVAAPVPSTVTGVSIRRVRARAGREVLVDTKDYTTRTPSSASGYNGDVDDRNSRGSSVYNDLMSLQQTDYESEGLVDISEDNIPPSSPPRDLVQSPKFSFPPRPSAPPEEKVYLSSNFADSEGGFTLPPRPGTPEKGAFTLPPRPGTPLEPQVPIGGSLGGIEGGFSFPPRPETPYEDQIPKGSALRDLTELLSGPPPPHSSGAGSETPDVPSMTTRKVRQRKTAMENPSEKKQEVSEPETRRLASTMGQKKPSGKKFLDGEDEGPKHRAHNSKVLYETFAKSFEQARSYRGHVTFEARFGRIVLIDVPKTIVKSSIDWTGWEHILKSADKIRRTFADKITLEFFDAEFICDLKLSRSELIFKSTAHEKKVVYEFHCSHKGYTRRLVVDAGTFEWKVYGPKEDFGTVYWDCPLRSWNARIAIRGRKLIDRDRALYQSLVDSIQCEQEGLSTPSFEFTTRGADFQIKKIFCKRSARYMTAPHRLHGGFDIALSVTESQELIIHQHVAKPGTYRIVAKEREDAKATGHIGYSFDLISLHIERILKENSTLEIGEDAGWTVEDTLGESADDTSLTPFMEVLNVVIKKIDDVGFHNNAGTAMTRGE
ncbi:hypothetical protein RUND412_006539 [Rhizina undulata]